MQLFYYKSEHGNFGDDLNAWLWEYLQPGAWSEGSRPLFSGIGSIIGNPTPPADRIVIFSSGIGYSPIPADFHSDRFDVRAVRGPMSARVLGLPPEKAVADGALLLAKVPEFAPLPEDRRHGVVFVPHHEVMTEPAWLAAAALAGVEVLDPRGECRSVLHRLRSARLVIADSMHAAIIADTLRVPWVPVTTSSATNTIKWLDWSLALGLPYEPTALPAPSLEAAYRSWTNPLIGNGFSVWPPTVDAAMEHFHGVMAANRRRWAWHRKHYARRLVDTGSQAMNALPIARRTDGSPSHREERCARALQDLTTRAGYLSDGGVLRAKVDELSHLLDDVRAAHV